MKKDKYYYIMGGKEIGLEEVGEICGNGKPGWFRQKRCRVMIGGRHCSVVTASLDLCKWGPQVFWSNILGLIVTRGTERIPRHMYKMEEIIFKVTGVCHVIIPIEVHV